jgi:hypothetical protein
MRDFLFNVDIKKESPYDGSIQELYEGLFRTINRYREFKKSIEEILAYPKAEKGRREYQLYRLFNVPPERMTSLLKAGMTLEQINKLGYMSFPTNYIELRKGIASLENKLKRTDIVDFE